MESYFYITRAYVTFHLYILKQHLMSWIFSASPERLFFFRSISKRVEKVTLGSLACANNSLAPSGQIKIEILVLFSYLTLVVPQFESRLLELFGGKEKD